MNSYTVVIEPDEEAFHAYVPSLPGCHTFGDTVDEALAHIQEAMMLYLELLQEKVQRKRHIYSTLGEVSYCEVKAVISIHD
ncbi:MAG: type II toxin-antitoxin system HicB family antitoxin [Chloroflexi bacterium]|nr:type II toxin-antitoxin system HicB family antitoxin [Chloroflexota bacterium]